MAGAVRHPTIKSHNDRRGNLIEYVVKGNEDPHENETADLAAVDNEGIELIGILEEVPERETQKSSQEELIYHLCGHLNS